MPPVTLALADFDQYASSSPAGPPVFVSPTSPIAGSNSLNLVMVASTGGATRLLVPKTGVGALKAIYHGRLRAAWNRTVASNRIMYGFACAQSVENVISSGNCYTVTFYETLSEASRITLRKHTSGLSANGTNLVHAAWTGTTATRTLQVIWDISGAAALFEVFLGTALDWSDLASQFTYQDTSSPFLVTAGEGFFFRMPDNATGTDYTVRVDNIEMDVLS